jgi:hypothetical protein
VTPDSSSEEVSSFVIVNPSRIDLGYDVETLVEGLVIDETSELVDLKNKNRICFLWISIFNLEQSLMEKILLEK